jgi:phosphoribosylanthranilate isomerase
VIEPQTLFAHSSGLVKICGLSEPQHAAAAAEAGADLLGFIFAPARRRISAERAAECIAAARGTAPEQGVLAVGVFVDASADEINAMVERAGLDLVQLHGDEPAEMLENIIVPAMKVFRPQPGDDSHRIGEAMDRYLATPRPPLAVVVDGFSEKGAGGEGVRADWVAAAGLAAGRPLVLAGGLSPENVGDAIERVRPLGVDVSSGVETDGIKDPLRIVEFVAAARAAFAELTSVRL